MSFLKNIFFTSQSKRIFSEKKKNNHITKKLSKNHIKNNVTSVKYLCDNNFNFVNKIHEHSVCAQ